MYTPQLFVHTSVFISQTHNLCICEALHLKTKKLKPRIPTVTQNDFKSFLFP